MERLKLTQPEDLATARKRQVAELYHEGFRQIEIAARLGITQARVSQIMQGIERTRTNKRHMLRLMPTGASASA